jgi:hypothetical protein
MPSGISGSRVSRANADSITVPGNDTRPVAAWISTSPSEYTSDAPPSTLPSTCSGLR